MVEVFVDITVKQPLKEFWSKSGFVPLVVYVNLLLKTTVTKLSFLPTHLSIAHRDTLNDILP